MVKATRATATTVKVDLDTDTDTSEEEEQKRRYGENAILRKRKPKECQGSTPKRRRRRVHQIEHEELSNKELSSIEFFS